MTIKYFNVKQGITTGNIVVDAATGNITNVGNLSLLGGTTANIGNLAIANFFQGNGSLLTSIAGGNVSGQVGNALIAGTVYTNAQPNITSVGTLSSLAITGDTTSGNVYANSGTIGASLLTGTLTTQAQPNITSVGLLSSLTVGNSTANVQISVSANGALEATANITAPYFIGNVQGNISGNIVVPGNNTAVLFNNSGNAGASDAFTFNSSTNVVTITGNLTSFNANLGNLVTANYVTGTLTTQAQPNITSLGTLTTLTVTGNVTSGNASLGNLASATYFSGDGSLLTNITGGNVTGQVGNALVAGTVYTNAQPNITSLGTLANLIVTGTANTGDALISGNATVTGNLVVQGNTIYANVETLVVEDPVIELGGGPNGAPLTNNDGKDRGTLLHYYTTGTIDAFMGWDNSNGEFGFGSNVTNSSDVMTFNEYGNIRAAYYLGNGSLLTGVAASTANSANTANTANTVIDGNQSNITSVGTLTTLSVSGNITSGNASLGNLVTATYFSGDGSLLTNITGGNVTGQVGNALVAGTVYTNAQPNITSVGTLTSLSVTGNVSAGNVLTDNLRYANGTPYVFTTNAAGSNTQVQFNDGNAFAGSANFTFDKGTNTLSVTNIVANGAGLTSLTGGNVTGQVANALVAGTVYTNAQPNITSVGTLASLTVTGLITATGTGIKTSNIQDSAGTITIATGYGNVSGDVGIYGNLVVGTSGTGNITAYNASLGNLVIGNYFSGNGSLLTGINGSNVTGQVGNALVAGTVYTNAQPNITSVGTLSSLSVTGNTTTGNLKLDGGITSNRSNVSITTNTVVDQFGPTDYRTAKYIISASGDDGFQSVETLLVHDGVNSYITIYGSICSNNSADIIDLSSNVNGISGNVSLYATSSSANAKVNVVVTYIKT